MPRGARVADQRPPFCYIACMRGWGLAATLLFGCSTASGDGSLPATTDASTPDASVAETSSDAAVDAYVGPDPSCLVPDVDGPVIATSGALDLAVTDTVARTNVAMRLCTPSGPRTATFVGVTGAGPYTWRWKADPLPVGETQLIFLADPASKVWSTRRVTTSSTVDAKVVDTGAGLCDLPAKNLIAHGTFEEGMDGLAPKGWQVRNPDRPGACSGAPSDHVFLGDSACGKGVSLDSKGTWDCYAIQTVSDYKTITAGRTYRIRATVRSRGNAPDAGYCPECTAAWFTVGAQWLDAGDAFFGDVKNPKTTETDYDWKVLSFDVVAPAGAERILVWLTAHYPGRVDYDDVSVVELP